MNRLRLTGIVALAALAMAGAAAASSGTHVNFMRWKMTLSGSSKAYSALPGSTFKYCSSKRLVRMRIFYKTTGPSTGPDNENWYLNGQFWKHFRDDSLGTSGSFELVATVKDGHRIPSGHWALSVSYGGHRVGHTTITVAERHC